MTSDRVTLHRPCTGVVNRKSSSIAPRIVEGCSISVFRCSGYDVSNSAAPAISPDAVSFPPAIMTKAYPRISSVLSRRPSAPSAASLDSMSSPGSAAPRGDQLAEVAVELAKRVASSISVATDVCLNDRLGPPLEQIPVIRRVRRDSAQPRNTERVGRVPTPGPPFAASRRRPTQEATNSRRAGSIGRTLAGEKLRFTLRRFAVWSGGSIITMVGRSGSFSRSF